MADVTRNQEIVSGGRLTPVATPLFGGDVSALTVAKDVHLAQVLSEIDAALGNPDKYQVVLELTDPEVPASETNPLTIFVHPADTDMTVVQSIVDAHVPNPDHGKTEEQKEIDALKARLAEGDLALPDLNRLVRSMLGG